MFSAWGIGFPYAFGKLLIKVLWDVAAAYLLSTLQWSGVRIQNQWSCGTAGSSCSTVKYQDREPGIIVLFLQFVQYSIRTRKCTSGSKGEGLPVHFVLQTASSTEKQCSSTYNAAYRQCSRFTQVRSTCALCTVPFAVAQVMQYVHTVQELCALCSSTCYVIQ